LSFLWNLDVFIVYSSTFIFSSNIHDYQCNTRRHVVLLEGRTLCAIVSTSEWTLGGSLLVSEAVDVVSLEVSAWRAVAAGAGVLSHSTWVAGL
jgi:hypothetical protein